VALAVTTVRPVTPQPSIFLPTAFRLNRENMGRMRAVSRAFMPTLPGGCLPKGNQYDQAVYLGISSFVQALCLNEWFIENGGRPQSSEARMIENQKIRPASVIGPLGEAMTIDTLPPPGTTRWVVRRKAEVVAAVNGGLLTVDEVCDRYSLTIEEFAGWQRAVDRSGMPGLRVTRIQHYKSLYERQQRY